MWNWYVWEDLETYEKWHTEILPNVILDDKSKRYNDPHNEIDGTIKSMVEDKFADGLTICEEPSLLRVRSNA